MRSPNHGKAKLNRLNLGALRALRVGWFSACGAAIVVASGCSSGSSDVVDSGNGSNSSSGSGSGSGSSSSSSGGSGSGGGSSSSGGGSSGSSSSGSGSGSSSGGGSSGGAGDAGGFTILFPFSQASDVPGGNVSTCPNNMKGCWFWDEYNPMCSIPLGGSEAGASSGVEAGVAEAAAGDGANPCPYPNVEPILSFDSAEGDTNPGGDPGSMKIQVPFTAYNQQALIQWIFPGTMMDLSTKTLFARVRFDSGGNPNVMSNPNGFRIVVKTGTGYVYGPSQYFNLTQTGQTMFVEYDFPLTATPAGANAGWDATQAVAIEIEFDTGGGPAAGVDAGGGPTMATFHVDTIGTVP